MATVKVKRPAPKTTPHTHPHVTVASSAGSVTLGAVDVRTGFAGLGSTWASIERPGTNALLRRATRNRLTYTVPALLINGMSGKTVEQQILALDAICASNALCGVSYAEMANHKWILTEVTGGVVRQRAVLTNVALHADVSLTFVVAVNERQTVAVARKVSSARKSNPPSNKPRATVTSVVVRSGDTLSKIAARVYGNANRWPEIAKKNSIRNPALIKVGQRLRV